MKLLAVMAGFRFRACAPRALSLRAVPGPDDPIPLSSNEESTAQQ